MPQDQKDRIPSQVTYFAVPNHLWHLLLALSKCDHVMHAQLEVQGLLGMHKAVAVTTSQLSNCQL